MTRFLFSLDDAVDLIFTAVRHARRGETFIPHVPSARMIDVASAFIDGRGIETMTTGIRPGEKLHEILVSEEESHRTVEANGVYVIGPLLPELQSAKLTGPFLEKEYSSEFDLMSPNEVRQLLIRRNLMVDQQEVELEGEFLR